MISGDINGEVKFFTMTFSEWILKELRSVLTGAARANEYLVPIESSATGLNNEPVVCSNARAALQHLRGS